MSDKPRNGVVQCNGLTADFRMVMKHLHTPQVYLVDTATGQHWVHEQFLNWDGKRQSEDNMSNIVPTRDETELRDFIIGNLYWLGTASREKAAAWLDDAIATHTRQRAEAAEAADMACSPNAPHERRRDEKHEA